MPGTTPNGIEFEELEGSPRLKISRQGITGTRMFLVAWDSALNFALEHMGVIVDVAGAVTQSEPLLAPGMPVDLVPSNIDLDPFDPSKPDGSLVEAGTGMNRYDNGARITINYAQRIDGSFGQPEGAGISVPGGYVTYQRSTAAQYMTVPSRMWRWGDPGGVIKLLPEDVPVAIVEPLITHNFTWNMVRRPPWTAMSELAGKVNAAAYIGSPAETLLFAGTTTSTSFGNANSQALMWSLTYQILELRHDMGGGNWGGWNHYYVNDETTNNHWTRIRSNEVPQNPPFLTGDLSRLFAFG